jgi:hypothetical protein
VSKDTELFGAFAHRQTENAMKLHRTSRHHPEIGSITLRMLWIPAVAAIVITGYIALHRPQHELAPTMAVAAANELATQAPSTSPVGTTTGTVVAPSELPDEAIVQQRVLDPIGAGLDIAH